MSRPTELQLRPPKEITQTIYSPEYTYEGHRLSYEPKRFPGHKTVFLVAEERFRFTKL